MVGPSIDLYTTGTPNGRRAAIVLEALNLQYNYHQVDITKGEQLTDSFKKLSPYGKIPVITDIDPNTGKEISVFESGAIIEFIANKYDTEFQFHYDSKHPFYWEQVKWFQFTTASLSPQQGNLSFYLNFAKEKLPLAIEKSRAETLRVYDVLEQRLKENDGWFVGDHVNIVDISAYPFVRRHDFVGVDLESNYPNVWEWLQKLNKIEAFEKGYSI